MNQLPDPNNDKLAPAAAAPDLQGSTLPGDEGFLSGLDIFNPDQEDDGRAHRTYRVERTGGQVENNWFVGGLTDGGVYVWRPDAGKILERVVPLADFKAWQEQAASERVELAAKQQAAAPTLQPPRQDDPNDTTNWYDAGALENMRATPSQAKEALRKAQEEQWGPK